MAAQGWLLSAVLKLGEEPIAYQLGLSYNGVYDCLKTSFVDNYKRYGPGNLLTQMIIDLLYERNIRYCDLQGAVDDFKAKWTTKTYQRITYITYRNGMLGWLARISVQIRNKISNFLGRGRDLVWK